MNFEHLKKSYEIQMADIKEMEVNSNDLNVNSLKASAYETLVSYYLANNDKRYLESLSEVLSLNLAVWKNSNSIDAWDFILYTCISLALKDTDTIKQMLELEVKTDGYHRLTVEWFGLQRAILTSGSYNPRAVKKSKGEESIFKAFTDIMNKTEPDWKCFDIYWKSTRNRSHKFTMLQHRDLLKDGMKYFWEMKSE